MQQGIEALLRASAERKTAPSAPHRIALALAVLLMVNATPSAAKTFCMVKVHGKGGAELADPVWAENYWGNGQFQSIAQPCGGMPTLTTHADGTVGTDVVFDRQYCGCGIFRWQGCDTLYRPADGRVDVGIDGTRPTSWINGTCGTNEDYCACTSTAVSPRQFSTPPQYVGLLEQINTFLDQTGCDDLTIVTHSNGGNIIRWGFSYTQLYDSSLCKNAAGSTYAGCVTLKQHQLRVINATTHVIILHAPSAGSEAANLVATLSGSWLTGWIADWIGTPYVMATQQLTTGTMMNRNTRFMYGTSKPEYTTDGSSRPWPIFTAKGENIRVARWISMASSLSQSQILEDAAHAEDYQLWGCAGVVPFKNGQSDGLVAYWSQSAVGEVWVFSGQHDTAARAYTASNLYGHNHFHPLLGAAGGGQWTPRFWYQEPTYLTPGVSPSLAGPGPCTGSGANYVCPGWPWPSVYHGVAVPACHDQSFCKRNMVRGNPTGGDEAFEVSAFIGARAAEWCGPSISTVNVWDGQYQDFFRRVSDTQIPARFSPYWQLISRSQIYDAYAPQAGMQVCQWQC